MARSSHDDKGISLAKGPVALLGLAMIAWGVLSFIFGGNGFTAKVPSGTVNGQTFLGAESNGWTDLLWIAGGLLLAFGSPLHWAAKSMALVVGLVLGAASVISMVDGDDVFGIFAANGLTQLLWGAVAVALIVVALLPRVGKGRKGRDRDRTDDRHREVVRERRPLGYEDSARINDRESRFEREGTGERVERETRVVAPADGDGPRDHGRDRL